MFEILMAAGALAVTSVGFYFAYFPRRRNKPEAPRAPFGAASSACAGMPSSRGNQTPVAVADAAGAGLAPPAVPSPPHARPAAMAGR